MGRATGFNIFIHNKGQMHFPKVDKIFGSEFISIDMTEKFKQAKKEERFKQVAFRQTFELSRTRWKTLDTPAKRCDDTDASPNTTECITHFVENTIGCSMGMDGSNPSVAKR